MQNTTMQNRMWKLLALALTTAFISGGVAEAAPGYKRRTAKTTIPVKNTNRGTGLDRVQAEKAVTLYRQRIGLNTDAPGVCDWQGKVVNAMLVFGSRGETSDEIATLVRTYLTHKKSGTLEGATLEKCRLNAQGVTAEISKTWHNKALQIASSEGLGNIEKLYQLYLESFPQASDIGDMQYYYAELLWLRAEYEKDQKLASQRWEKAAIAFTAVVQNGKVNANELKNSAYAAVLSWKNALAVDPRTMAASTVFNAKNAEQDTPEARPIGSREKMMLAAFETYSKYIEDPSDDEVVMLTFLKARVYWRHGRLQESLPFFYEIVEKHSEHELALFSANLLLDSLIRLKKYDEVNKLVHKLLKNKKFAQAHDELRERLLGIKSVVMRKAAEQLEKSGRHIACGQAYLDIYNANPSGGRMDEVLYNAGVCFEQGKAMELAVGMYALLSKRFPRSPRNHKGLIRTANIYGSMAEYEKAAEKYEAYAMRYGAENDDPFALLNAATYRKAVGMDKAAIENIENFVKRYKKRMKEETAAAIFGLADIYEKHGDKDKVIETYKRYLKEVGRSGGMDRLLIANAKIGEMLWKQSCKSTVDGVCANIKHERAARRNTGKKRGRGLNLPRQCGGAKSKVGMSLVSRNRRKTAEAKKYFKAALALVKKGAIERVPDPSRRAAAIYWMAATRFYMVGERYEKYLSLNVPAKLNFSPNNEKKKRDSEMRFNEWNEDKKKLAAQLYVEYGEIKDITGGGAAWAIAAAARVGQLHQNFSLSLLTAEIPKELRLGPQARDEVDAYCAGMTTAAEGFENKSIQAFGFCLNLSTSLNWFNDWSRLCEKELAQMRPAHFPIGIELHGQPNGVADITDTAPLQSE